VPGSPEGERAERARSGPELLWSSAQASEARAPAESGPGAGLTRRELLRTGAAVAGYALAAGPVRAEAVGTEATGLVAGMVEVPVGDRRIPAYRARPEGTGPFPVVLVVHEIFGLHEYVRDVCRRLARAGYLALAPDLYARQGDATRAPSVEVILREIVGRVPDAQVVSDLDAAAAWAASDGGKPGALFITGFCWGGRIVWLYSAHRRDLAAGAAWYGRLTGPASALTPEQPIDVAGRLHGPVLGLYGEADAGIPLESVSAMRKQLDSAGGTSEIVVFPDAPHGFHADYRESYRPVPAKEGWRRMLEWFQRHAGGAPPGKT
jgi:carboxymethylenebutenolidase